MLFGPMAPE
jgi:hypothetical protein